ncbi:MAG: Crp/Fnr family transcriptional regulator [Anaerolineales bacterium]|jgi:CRP/FNR family transcriptional regulator, nitrogen oxide reductase regulator
MSERRKSPVDAESITPQMCSTDVRLEVLSRVPFFAGLADEDLRRINRLFREQGFASGEAIYFAGDPAARLYVVAEGKVKLMRHTWAGKDVMLDMLAPGEFFGSLSTLRHDQYPDTAQSQTAACVLSIESEEFRDILKDYPQVALKVLDITSERLKSAHETIRQLSVFSVERRIAHTLLKLGEKLGQQDKVGLLIQVPLSRDDLAEMTGTTTESASRVMSQFQKDGLIESGRQWVAITDLEGLESIAQEDI